MSDLLLCISKFLCYNKDIFIFPISYFSLFEYRNITNFLLLVLFYWFCLFCDLSKLTSFRSILVLPIEFSTLKNCATCKKRQFYFFSSLLSLIALVILNRSGESRHVADLIRKECNLFPLSIILAEGV